MSLARDPILDALLSRFAEDVPGLRLCTRRDQDFTSAPKPALILVTDSQERDDLGRWEIRAHVNVMVHITASDQSPETKLNEYVDAVDDALDARPDELPSDGFRTTLGGLCASCRVAGRIEMRQGINGIGEVSIPVEIIAYEAD
jgi:hypothetical protein